MIPKEFKYLNLKYDKEGDGYYYVTFANNPHMIWVGEYYRNRHPSVFDTEGFLIFDFLPETFGKYPELIYLRDNPEYRHYIKNFVVKSLL